MKLSYGAIIALLFKHMKISGLLLITTLWGAHYAAAQTPAAGKTADGDWNGLTTLRTTPVSTSVQGKKKAFADITRDKADAARAVAQAAKKFYTDYPDHVNAAEARRVEAVNGLLGVIEGDRAQEASALQVARKYRADKTNPVSSRFEVALLVERTDVKSGQSVRSTAPSARQLEQIADKLRVEFGEITEVFNFYASVARGADMNSANTLAAKMLQWQTVTRDAKIEAQAIVDRHTLLAKPLNWKLPELDKVEPLDLTKSLGKPAIIFLSWHDEAGDNFDSLVKYKKTIPATFQVIYLTLGATEAQLRATKSNAPIAGIHCLESRGSVGPAAEQFLVRQTPYVYVLTRAGALAGYGPLSELPSLIAAANR